MGVVVKVCDHFPISYYARKVNEVQEQTSRHLAQAKNDMLWKGESDKLLQVYISIDVINPQARKLWISSLL
jgi:hypothetical protein